MSWGLGQRPNRAGASEERTRRLAADGQTFAYRRIGLPSPIRPPLLLLPMYRANLDTWDPDLLDALALEREVVLFDNLGVGASTGVVPRSVTEMARDTITFVHALDPRTIHGTETFDVLGHGLGGMVAQELALLSPSLVRRLVLAATAPQGGPRQHRWPPDTQHLASVEHLAADELLRMLFEMTETSRSKGKEYLARIARRTDDVDQPSGDTVRDRQGEALRAWAVPDRSKLERLSGITAPTLVVTADNDPFNPPDAAHQLAEHLPNVLLRTFPDSGHGFLFQYPVEFATLIASFLA